MVLGTDKECGDFTVGTSHLDGRRAPGCPLFKSPANGKNATRLDQREGPVWVMGWTAPDGIDCARMRSLQISNKGDRPWNRLAELAWTRRNIFSKLHGVNAAEKVVLRKKLRRKEMVVFFEALAPTLIGIEACGASHHWARILPAVEVIERLNSAASYAKLPFVF